MTEAFETWAAREIRRLRDEADVLQLALDRFQAAQGRKSRGTTDAAMVNDAQQRRSKHEALYALFIQASVNGPLTYADMSRIADEAGMPQDRSVLRSWVFSQKRAGRVRAQGDGYVWITPQTEAASPVKEDAAL